MTPPRKIPDAALHALIFLFYILFFVALFYPVVFQDMTFARRDILRFYYPLWKFGVDCLRHGIIPLWDPYNCFGMPFFANVQTCVFYPLSILLHLPDYTWAFNFYILFHLALAGFFTFLWMRDCGASLPAALLSGFAFGLSGYMMSTINLTISLCTAAYFPLVLLVFRKALRDKRFFWKGITAVVLLFQYLAGDPAIFAATFFVLALFSVYKVFEACPKAGILSLKNLFPLVQIGFVFLGLSAFQTVMFAEFLSHSDRVHFAFSQTMQWSTGGNDLLSIIIPFFKDFDINLMDYTHRQSWLDTYYAGVSVVVLAAVAAFRVKRHPAIGYHILLALLGIALALGKNSYVWLFLHEHIPLLGFIRYPVRLLFLFYFSAASLAGFGLDFLTRLPKNREAPSLDGGKALFPIAALLTLAALTLMSTLFFPDICRAVAAWIERYHSIQINYRLSEVTRFRNNHLLPGGPETIKNASQFISEGVAMLIHAAAVTIAVNTRRTLLFLTLAVTGLVAAAYLKPKRVITTVFFFALIFTDLLLSNICEPNYPSSVLERPSRNISWILKDPGLFRVLASPRAAMLQLWGTDKPPQLDEAAMKDLLIDNHIMVFGIYNASAYNSIYVIRAALMAGAAIGNFKSPGYIDHSSLMNMLNIKYLVSPEKKLTDQFKLSNETETANLFENPTTLPRAYLTQNPRILKNGREMLIKVTAQSFDSEKEIYLEEAPPPPQEPKAPGSAKGAESKVRFLKYSPNEVRMSVFVSDKPWLFFSDTFYPGWKAWVDNQEVKIYRANYAFRALFLSPGRHEIIWRYDPWLFKAGLGVTTLVFLALAVYYLRLPFFTKGIKRT